MTGPSACLLWGTYRCEAWRVTACAGIPTDCPWKGAREVAIRRMERAEWLAERWARERMRRERVRR